MPKPKIKYKQQDKTVLAITCFGHAGTSIAWSSGNDPNIIHATRAVRKAKRDNKSIENHLIHLCGSGESNVARMLKYKREHE